jgi:hypothetical protein
MGMMLFIANTGEATFASNVLSLGNISSTRTNPVLKQFLMGHLPIELD